MAERALIVAPAWVGDAIMAQPLLARLRQANPDMAMDALSPAWVAPAFARMPEIRHVHLSPFAHGELALHRRFSLALRLKKSGYTRAYVLPNSFKSALIPFFAAIPRRVGFTGEARYGLINARHVLDKAALPRMVERFAQLAEKPGAPLPRPISNPRLISTPEQQRATLRKLALEEEEGASAKAPILFCPGAEYGPAKRWPVGHFAALAAALCEEDGARIWFIGSGKDRILAEDILARLPMGARARCRNLCGSTRLEEAIDLIAFSRLVVCNDSGLMHVAAALDRPLVALFGSSSPDFTPPLSEKAQIMRLNLDCSPCFKRECPLGHLNCLFQLTPEQVLTVCQTKLA
ncbi:MAG: lipopolysaccharide heptosyltransferase II [Zoogloeaceae bacterium]|jgi:heptosyltransferase-2|nr:lipopolysaccharide heptosyltransferase II [Zoogloeaceae bacterium]